MQVNDQVHSCVALVTALDEIVFYLHRRRITCIHSCWHHFHTFDCWHLHWPEGLEPIYHSRFHGVSNALSQAVQGGETEALRQWIFCWSIEIPDPARGRTFHGILRTPACQRLLFLQCCERLIGAVTSNGPCGSFFSKNRPVAVFCPIDPTATQHPAAPRFMTMAKRHLT